MASRRFQERRQEDPELHYYESEKEARQVVQSLRREMGQQQERTIGDALKEYERHMREKGNKPKSITETTRRLRLFFPELEMPLAALNSNRCQAYYDELAQRPAMHPKRQQVDGDDVASLREQEVSWRDICAKLKCGRSAAMRALEQRGQPEPEPRKLSADSHRNMLAEAKSFTRWCTQDKRWLKANPLDGVKARASAGTGSCSCASTRRASGRQGARVGGARRGGRDRGPAHAVPQPALQRSGEPRRARHRRQRPSALGAGQQDREGQTYSGGPAGLAAVPLAAHVGQRPPTRSCSIALHATGRGTGCSGSAHWRECPSSAHTACAALTRASHTPSASRAAPSPTRWGTSPRRPRSRATRIRPSWRTPSRSACCTS